MHPRHRVNLGGCCRLPQPHSPGDGGPPRLRAATFGQGLATPAAQHTSRGRSEARRKDPSGLAHATQAGGTARGLHALRLRRAPTRRFLPVQAKKGRVPPGGGTAGWPHVFWGKGRAHGLAPLAPAPHKCFSRKTNGIHRMHGCGAPARTCAGGAGAPGPAAAQCALLLVATYRA